MKHSLEILEYYYVLYCLTLHSIASLADSQAIKFETLNNFSQISNQVGYLFSSFILDFSDSSEAAGGGRQHFLNLL